MLGSMSLRIRFRVQGLQGLGSGVTGMRASEILGFKGGGFKSKLTSDILQVGQRKQPET